MSEEERTAVLRYYHVQDAKLALGSALLKRYAISRFTGVPWTRAKAQRDARTKPVFKMPGDGSEPLLFNVSHQAGLVVLLAVHNPPPGLAVGVDVVSPLERRERDRKTIAADGWPYFVDMHADVFSPAEAAALKQLAAPGSDTSLRSFYALWCLREAYVKMTGEALLASWLGELEMRNFAPPGERTQALEVWFRGERVADVDMTLVSLLDDNYMVSMAMRHGENGVRPPFGEFVSLDIGEVLGFGEMGC